MSSLAYQDLSLTLKKDLPSSISYAIKDEDDRLRLRRDKPCSMDEALSLACELEACTLMKMSGSLIYFKSSAGNVT